MASVALPGQRSAPTSETTITALVAADGGLPTALAVPRSVDTATRAAMTVVAVTAARGGGEAAPTRSTSVLDRRVWTIS